MNKTSEKQNSDDICVEQINAAPPDTDRSVNAESRGLTQSDAPHPPLSCEEKRQMQDEKLASIRRAIDSGAYDSDDLLHRALGRMIDQLEESGSLDDTARPDSPVTDEFTDGF